MAGGPVPGLTAPPPHRGGHDVACDYLARADQALAEATAAVEHTARYAAAHMAALRAAAAVLAIRGRPHHHRNQRNAWVLLAAVAPELAEWAAFFAAGSAKRSAAEAGRSRAVTVREADDLLRDATQFVEVVEQCLGVSRQQPLSYDLHPRRAG